MQQSSLSTRTANNNDGTVASRMLHSLIQDYNNASSVPPSPRQSTEYYRSSHFIKPQQTQHLQLPEENQEVNVESYRSNLSMGSQSHLVELMVKKESQLKELENFIMKEIQEINENKERQSRIKDRILSVRESMCEIRQSHCQSGMLVRGQLQQMKEQLANKFQQMVVYLLTEHKQTTQTYITEINRLKDQLTEKQAIISQNSILLNENQSIIKSLQQQIAKLKQKQLEYGKIQKHKDLQLQRLTQELQNLKQKQLQKKIQTQQNIQLQISQIRQRQKEQEKYRQKHRKSLGIHIAEDNDQELSIQSHYNQDQPKSSLVSERQKLSLRTHQLNPHSQHHLEVSFSADTRDQQTITHTLQNQPTLNNNSKECLLNLGQSCSQDEKLIRQNTNSDKQLTGAFGDGSDYMKVRFQVETSSIQQKSQRQEECEFDNGNTYNEEKVREQYSKNGQRVSGQNERYYERSLNHSQSQKSPKQESLIQSSQVHRMNTMSFSLNQVNDITAINQLDVFSDNGFGQSNKNKQDPMSDYEEEHEQIDKQRKSIVRSHGGAYSFKKGHSQLQNRQQTNDNKTQLLNQGSKQSIDNKETKPVMTKVKGENKIAIKQEKQSLKTIQKNGTPPNKSHNKQSQEINPQSKPPMLVEIVTNGKTIKNQSQPPVPKVTSTSVINLQPVQQQSAASTKTKRSPHRYDYCRLYQQQEIKQIQNINQVCNNILLNSGGSTKRQSNTIQNPIQVRKITPFPSKDYSNRSMTGNDDIIKQRLSSLKNDIYPSFRNTPKESTNINTAFTNISSMRTPISPRSHSKKGLTIQIPQSPSVSNPYYKVENHLHQISVKEFSPQKAQKYTDRNNITSYSIHSKTQQKLQNKQLSYYNRGRDREIEAEQNVSIHTNRSQLLASHHKQPLSYQQNNNVRENHNQTPHDRKQYIKSKIQHIKRKNLNQTTHFNQTNTVYKDNTGNINTYLYQDTTLNRNKDNNMTKNHYNVNEFTGGRSPRIISFLKSQQQQNIPSKLELERPSAVNRSVMINSNTNRSPGKTQQRQKSQQSYSNIKGYDNTNKVYDNTNKVYDNTNKVYNNTASRSYQQVRSFDFNDDKLQKTFEQQIRSNKELLNKQKPLTSSPEFRKTNTKGSKLSENESSSYTNKKILGENNHNGDRKTMRDVTDEIGNSNNFKGNDIYEQLNNHKNPHILKNQQRQQQSKSPLKQIVRQSEKKSPLKRNIQNNYLPLSSHGLNSSTMSPLNLSKRNNNSLYLQGSQVKSSSKNLANNNSSFNYYEQKHSVQNGHRNTPYVNNDRKTNTKTLINNPTLWEDNDQEDNLRWYDPSKGVAGFRRF